MKEKNADIVLILGNGFDLDLGLKSDYKSFVKSTEFNKLLNDSLHTSYFNGGNEDKSLLYHIQLANSQSNWFDLEEEIYKFVEQHQDVSNVRLGLINMESKRIRAALSDYLNRMTKHVHIIEYSFAKILFTYLINSLNKSICIYSFNYTNCFQLCGCDLNENTILWNIHGSLRNNNIVLGYDNYNNLQLQEKYEFLDKSLSLEVSGYDMDSALKSAKEVIFFGHSMNDMDFSYFNNYFKDISSISNKNQSLTFVCLDKKSELIIKSKIKDKRYDWRDINGHLKNVDFIHTHLWNEGNKTGFDKFCNRQ